MCSYSSLHWLFSVISSAILSICSGSWCEQIILRSSNWSRLRSQAVPPPLRLNHANHLKWVFILLSIISSGGAEGWDKERSACNFLDQHLRLGSWSDVMWCAAHERNCWLSYFRNQKPKTPIPCLQSQPDSVKLPFNRQRPHACQTDSSHYHDCLPLSRLPLGILRKPVLLLTTPPSPI